MTNARQAQTKNSNRKPGAAGAAPPCDAGANALADYRPLQPLAGKCILCDLDGTLIYTDRANAAAYRRAIQEVAPGTRVLHDDPSQRITRANLRTIAPGLTDSQYERIVALKETYEPDYLALTIPNAQLVATLKTLGRCNRIVLTTHCSERRARLTLEHHGLAGLFSLLITAPPDGVASHADKYARAIAILGVDPTQVVVLDDDPTAIAGAAAAGVPTHHLFQIMWKPG